MKKCVLSKYATRRPVAVYFASINAHTYPISLDKLNSPRKNPNIMPKFIATKNMDIVNGAQLEIKATFFTGRMEVIVFRERTGGTS